MFIIYNDYVEGAAKESVRDQESGKCMTLVDLCVPQRKVDLYCPVCEVKISKFSPNVNAVYMINLSDITIFYYSTTNYTEVYTQKKIL